MSTLHTFLQVVIFDGKADALFSGLFRFQKAFFLRPETKDLYGRVQLQKGPLGNILYPLYYTCSIDPAIVPGTFFWQHCGLLHFAFCLLPERCQYSAKLVIAYPQIYSVYGSDRQCAQVHYVHWLIDQSLTSLRLQPLRSSQTCNWITNHLLI